MKLAKVTGTLGLAVLTAIASPIAVAGDAGWYAGIGAGQTKAKIDDAKIISGLLGNGFTTTSISNDDSDTGYKIFSGYQFNRNFALEGGYFDLGKFGFTANTVPLGTLNGTIKLRGFNLDAIGTLPLTDKFSVFGRVGLNHAQARDSFTGTGLVYVADPNPSKRETNLKVGLGAQYNFTDALGMRLEAERYRINDAVRDKGDIDLVSVSLVYRFGAKAQAPAPERAQVYSPPAPQPMAVKAMPPPPPPQPAPPAPLVLTKVTFSADSLFDFNKADIKPAGKQDLDKLAADLKGTRYEVITVTGHTDRIGSHEYNMKLSTQRAETVQSYLVESAGIPSDKISAKGVDGSDPVTKPGECKGTKRTPKLIACLQPDRRVDVDVSAMKVSQ